MRALGRGIALASRVPGVGRIAHRHVEEATTDPLLSGRGSEDRLRELSGSVRLMLAVLDDAIRVYRGGATGGESVAGRARVRHELERWVESSDRDYLFAFERICETLNLPPERVRRYLHEQRRAARPQRLALRDRHSATRWPRRC